MVENAECRMHFVFVQAPWSAICNGTEIKSMEWNERHCNKIKVESLTLLCREAEGKGMVNG
jgi:hypothetical protein